MPDSKLILITGRSTKQGVGISEGKDLAEYRAATTVLELSQADIDRHGLHDGDIVRLKSRYGEATVGRRHPVLPALLPFSRCAQKK